MNDLLNKISSYHLFNYLLPGVLFVVLSKILTPYSFVQSDLVIGVFVYYFIGMVISRLGSLIVDPLLKGVTFIKFRPYEEFIEASKHDSKLETLSETNNTYRTFCALFTAIILIKAYALLEQSYSALQGTSTYWLLGFLLIMFLFSYRKQTGYITKRIKAHI